MRAQKAREGVDVMAQETTYAGILGDWQRLLGPLRDNSAELVHLEGLRAKLEGLLAQALAIQKEQAANKAAKQEASKRLRGIVPEGRRLANLMRVGVREHFGPRAEKLAEFNLQPFRGRPRLKAKPDPEEPKQPEPTSPSPPSTSESAADDPRV